MEIIFRITWEYAQKKVLENQFSFEEFLICQIGNCRTKLNEVLLDKLREKQRKTRNSEQIARLKVCMSVYWLSEHFCIKFYPSSAFNSCQNSKNRSIKNVITKNLSQTAQRCVCLSLPVNVQKIFHQRLRFFFINSLKELSPKAMKIVYRFSFISWTIIFSSICSRGSAEGLNKQDPRWDIMRL